MEALANALKGILDKISEFLNIFDLSFFISGATCFGALFVWLRYVERQQPEIKGGLSILVIVLACYIFGLVCFALGRQFRRFIENLSAWWKVFRKKIGERFSKNDKGDKKKDNTTEKRVCKVKPSGDGAAEDEACVTQEDHTNNNAEKMFRKGRTREFANSFIEIIEDHNLISEPPFSQYVVDKNNYERIWRLYPRLWAHLRTDPKYQASIELLNRYWVMAATYDGLTIAFMVWMAVWLRWGWLNLEVAKANCVGCLAALIINLIIIRVCFQEGKRYQQYQMEEIVATFADENAVTK